MTKQERALLDMALETNYVASAQQVIDTYKNDVEWSKSVEDAAMADKRFAERLQDLFCGLAEANYVYERHSSEIGEVSQVEIPDIVGQEVKTLNDCYKEQVYGEMMGVFQDSLATTSGDGELQDPMRKFSNRLETLRKAYLGMHEYITTGEANP